MQRKGIRPEPPGVKKSSRRNKFYHRNRKSIRFFSGNKCPEGKKKYHYRVMTGKNKQIMNII